MLLDKDAIHVLNLDDAQIRQTLVIGREGARQILQLLTLEQRQRAVVGGGGGWPEVLDSLNLNDAQKVRIKALMVNQERQKQALKEQQKQALKAGASQTPQNLEEEMKSIDEETMARINETLTPQQERQLADALSRRKVEENQVPLTDAQKARLGELKRGFGQQLETINADNTLTKEQKEGRLVDMKRSLESQRAQIVTPEQQKLMAEREQQSRTMRDNGPFHLVNLERVENLTSDQITRIQAIYAGVDRQFIQLLTATQQQRLQQMLTGGPKVEGKRPKDAEGSRRENAAGGPG